MSANQVEFQGIGTGQGFSGLLPAKQAVHVPLVVVPSYPGAQVHADSDTLPKSDTAFSWHGMHVPAPVHSLYVPASHAMHAVPSAPMYPATHEQSVRWLLPVAEEVLAGHAEHVSDPT